MKKDIKKDILAFLVLAIYSLHIAIQAESIRAYIFLLANIAAVTLIYVVKNKYIELVCVVLSFAAMEFIDPKCKFFTAIPLLLICAYKNILSELLDSVNRKKKQESVFSSLIIQSCLFLSIALIIYCLVLSIENNDTFIPYYAYRSLFLLLWLLFMFGFSLIDSYKNKNEKKERKQILGKLRFLYFVSAFAFSSTFFYCCVEHSPVSFTQFALFFPWLLLICSMFYNDDPYIKALSDNLENLLSKTPDKK